MVFIDLVSFQKSAADDETRSGEGGSDAFVTGMTVGDRRM